MKATAQTFTVMSTADHGGLSHDQSVMSLKSRSLRWQSGRLMRKLFALLLKLREGDSRSPGGAKVPFEWSAADRTKSAPLMETSAFQRVNGPL